MKPLSTKCQLNQLPNRYHTLRIQQVSSYRLDEYNIYFKLNKNKNEHSFRVDVIVLSYKIDHHLSHSGKNRTKFFLVIYELTLYQTNQLIYTRQYFFY